ncbi:fatty acyl-CoA reductase wat-like [Leguminivora glycinivorella]|uniref:fatty acyl-CoA reductase wat-like n=1 Tax=Leguminivora glycinivorella TaxID=1035111 RepID=UPI00200E5793|nr:fatty acyl-CoA reductase wat-like [Leguminivora glycinivorella]XP_048004156.1 fatty acyl-CoA reductase wat-like [Leguminivora glycinivorella]
MTTLDTNSNIIKPLDMKIENRNGQESADRNKTKQENMTAVKTENMNLENLIQQKADRNQEINGNMEQEIRNREINGNVEQENRNLEINVNSRKIDECLECRKDEKRLTEIQRFYHGKNIMITGATGFLGKVLMEKLLRSCPGVENIYLLVRQKRGKDIYTRIEEIFDDPVFDRLKEDVPKFRHKVVVIPGDCEAVGLGLSLSDRQILTEKVNVVFHSAATVKFDEHLRAALATNVRAPLHLLRLARDMKDLSVFMHVSTAYSNSHLEAVQERFYPCEASCDHLETVIDKLTDEQINQMLPTILGPWPNTYTFTKALAEKELRKNAGDLPLGIFRPAIVTSTAKEPLVCWLDNMYGPTGVAIGAVTGILRTLQCDEKVTADIVPVDMTVNCLMVAAANVHKTYKRSPPPEPPIFNYVSSVENRITWGEFMTHNLKHIDKNPFSNAVWYVSLTLHSSALMNQLYIIFLHLLPGVLVDALAVCIGRKPKMLKVYRKIHKFSSVLSYFCTREIQFCNRNIRNMWDSTPDDDKQIFPFSMGEVSWEEYFKQYLIGIRRYMFKESDDTLPQARIKWRRLYYLHLLVRLLFSALALYALWSILSALF